MIYSVLFLSVPTSLPLVHTHAFSLPAYNSEREREREREREMNSAPLCRADGGKGLITCTGLITVMINRVYGFH